MTISHELGVSRWREQFGAIGWPKKFPMKWPVGATEFPKHIINYRGIRLLVSRYFME